MLAKRRTLRVPLALALAATAAATWIPAALRASDHQDSPEVELNQKCDINDVYAFPGPTAGSIVLVLTTASPIAGSAITSFDENKLYQIKIDNTVGTDGSRDGIEDLVLQFTFKGTGTSQQVSMRGPVAPDNTGARNRIKNVAPTVSGGLNQTLTAGNVKLFAGLRDDPFYLDLAQFFAIVPDRRPVTGDLAGLQPPAGCFRPVGTAADYLAGFNCLALVVEMPASMLTGSGNGKIGIWATTSR